MAPSKKRKIAASRPKSEAGAAGPSSKRPKQNLSSDSTKCASTGASNQRSTSTSKDITQLPSDIWYEIMSHFDPILEKQQLVNLMLASQSLWEVGARRLYHTVMLDEGQLAKLITGGTKPEYRRRDLLPFTYLQHRRPGISKMTPRALRAFAYIKNVYLFPPPRAPGIEQLWNTTVPNVPLFPNVQYLVLRDWADQALCCPNCTPDRVCNSTRTGVCIFHRFYHVPMYNPYDDVVVFDTPEVCIYGQYSYDRLRYLPAKEKRNVTYDGVPVALLDPVIIEQLEQGVP